LAFANAAPWPAFIYLFVTEGFSSLAWDVRCPASEQGGQQMNDQAMLPEIRGYLELIEALWPALGLALRRLA
jgi:hypothetical protein